MAKASQHTLTWKKRWNGRRAKPMMAHASTMTEGEDVPPLPIQNIDSIIQAMGLPPPTSSVRTPAVTAPGTAVGSALPFQKLNTCITVDLRRQRTAVGGGLSRNPTGQNWHQPPALG